MRRGSQLILEQLQMSAMALHGLYENFVEEGAIEGVTPELEEHVNAVKQACDKVESAIRKLIPVAEAK